MPLSADSSAHSGRFHDMLSRLADWWKNGPRHFGLEGVSSEEMARMAQDLGLSVNDLTRLSERDDDATLLLYSRLQRLGLSKADIDQAGFRRDLERTCGLCPDKDICQHDLDMRAEGEEWKVYCPNRHSLEQLQAAKQAAAKG